MTQTIQTPLPLYLGLDGKPLQNGHLFFGVANGNPEINPIQVFWDAALTQPAAQPVRTVNGMPSRDGTPAALFADADHSLTIRDSAGRLVLYARDSFAFSLQSQLANFANGQFGAGMIGHNFANTYPPNTTGASLQALQNADASTNADLAALNTTLSANIAGLASQVRVWPKNNRVALLGDSITADGINNTVDETRNANRGFTHWIPFLTCQRVSSPQSLNFGISGQTSAQIAARVQSVVDSGAGICVVCAGTNDIGGFTTAQTQANLATIYNALAAARILIIALPILPRTLVPSSSYSFPQKVNEWIRQQQFVYPGFKYIYPIEFLDPFSTSYSPRPDWTYDGLHPKAIGAFTICRRIAEYLNTLIPYDAPSVTTICDFFNVDNPRGTLNPNPLLGGTSGTLGAGVTGQVADSHRVQAFANGGSIGSLVVTCSKDISTRTGIFNQRIVVGGTATGGFDTSVILDAPAGLSNLSPGDVIEGFADVEIPGATIGVSGIELYLAVSLDGTFKWVRDGYPIVADDYLWRDIGEARFRTPPLTLNGAIGPSIFGVKISLRNTTSAARSCDLRVNTIGFRKVVP